MKPNDVIQINENGPEGWVACLAQVSEVKQWGVQAWVKIPMKGDAFIRLKHEQFDVIGEAVLIPNPQTNPMKQKQVKLPSGEYVLAEVAGWDKYHNPIYDDILFPGSWQLLGADPTRLTEKEAGEIVQGETTVELVDANAGGGGRIKYTLYKDYYYGEYDMDFATASLDSLAASLGISKPYCVLKNKTDNNDRQDAFAKAI